MTDDGRRYRLITAPRDLRAGDRVIVDQDWHPHPGTVLHPMAAGSYGFVQVAGPPEEG